MRLGCAPARWLDYMIFALLLQVALCRARGGAQQALFVPGKVLPISNAVSVACLPRQFKVVDLAWLGRCLNI